MHSTIGNDPGLGMHRSSNGCLGKLTLVLFIIRWAESRAVSEAVENKGGDSHHPIGSVHCTTI